MKKLERIFYSLVKILNHYKDRISLERYEYSLGIVEKFKEWYKDRSVSASELYNMIDCKDEGEGLFEYAECGLPSEDKEIHCMWELVLSILMTIVRIAYEEEELPYQQDIEAIDFDMIERFYDCIIEDNMNVMQLYDFFCNQVCY